MAQKTAGVSTLFVVLQGGRAPPGPAQGRRRAGAGDGEGGHPLGGQRRGRRPRRAPLPPAPRRALRRHRQAHQAARRRRGPLHLRGRRRRRGSLIDDGDPPPPIDAEKLRKTFGVEKGAQDRYPDGYYQSQDGRRGGGRHPLPDRRDRPQERRRDRPPRHARWSSGSAPSRSIPPSPGPSPATSRAGLTEYGAITKDLTDVGDAGHPDHRGGVLPLLPAHPHARRHAAHHRRGRLVDVRGHRDPRRPPQHGDELPLHHHRRQRDQLRHHLHGALPGGAPARRHAARRRAHRPPGDLAPHAHRRLRRRPRRTAR